MKFQIFELNENENFSKLKVIEEENGIILFLQNFLKIKIYNLVEDTGPSVAERVIRIIRNLLKKPVFLKGNANWISELPSALKKYNNTFHSSTKLTPFQASKKSNE